jgi:hydroxymethylpyrimidine/phosphomethylpyrimidine kinase
VVLAIAGSDSGGGAGIQADLKAITAMGGWGTTAITCLTSQNLEGVRSVQPTEPGVLADQIDAVYDGFDVRAVKSGMLYSAELIEVVADRLAKHNENQLVVDPVMVATSGAALLRGDAVAALRDALLPMATIVTPNLHEAAILAGQEVTDLDSMTDAAAAIHELGPSWVLVKGGHLEGDALDVLFDGYDSHVLFANRIDATTATHGTGCTLASTIATGLAKGLEMTEAVEMAKRAVTAAIANHADIGDDTEALDIFWKDNHRKVVFTL